MDLEQLSTSQIILLTLFCAFITSMATSVATVSLMQQTPVSAGQTVSQVVERTIHEVIAPATSTAVTPSPHTTDDVASLDAVYTSVSPSVVRVTSSDGTAQVGVVIDGRGTILTDGNSLTAGAPCTIETGTAPQITAPCVVTKIDQATGVAYVHASSTIVWNLATIVRSNQPLGEDVFTIVLGTFVHLERGIITSLENASDGTMTCADTDIPAIGTGASSYGIPLFNRNGMLIGIRTHVSEALAQNCFVLFNIPNHQSQSTQNTATSTQ